MVAMFSFIEEEFSETMSSCNVTAATVAMTSEQLETSLLRRYAAWYSGYHGYVSLVVCAAGIVGNVLNVVVLTRSHMSISATNLILTALAVSDLLTMASYVPFAVQFYCRRVTHDRDRSMESHDPGNTR